jgi:hypothetical protein
MSTNRTLRAILLSAVMTVLTVIPNLLQAQLYWWDEIKTQTLVEGALISDPIDRNGDQSNYSRRSNGLNAEIYGYFNIRLRASNWAGLMTNSRQTWTDRERSSNYFGGIALWMLDSLRIDLGYGVRDNLNYTRGLENRLQVGTEFRSNWCYGSGVLEFGLEEYNAWYASRGLCNLPGMHNDVARVAAGVDLRSDYGFGPMIEVGYYNIGVSLAATWQLDREKRVSNQPWLIGRLQAKF